MSERDIEKDILSQRTVTQHVGSILSLENCITLHAICQMQCNVTSHLKTFMHYI